MRRWIPYTAFSLLMLILLGCGGAESDDPGATREPGEPVEVRLRTASVETLPRTIRATGYLEALRTVSPGTKILGRIEQVRFREGDRVEKGQLLASLESRDLEAAVRRAEASVRLAEAQLENAAAQARRIADLHARGSATDKTLEDATSGKRVAEASRDHAQAQLAAAEVMLSYADIRSPVTGWVADRLVEAGDMASPGRPLFVLEDLSGLFAVVQLPEGDVVGLEPGAQARVEVLGRELPGTVRRIVPAGDPRSRTFTVKVLLDGGQETLKSGMFVRVDFTAGERSVLRVPEEALVVRGQLEGLWIAGEDGRLRLRWIRTGSRAGGQAEILSGLEAGESYVSEPRPGWIDGMPFQEVR